MLEKIKDLIFLVDGNCYLCREAYAKDYICPSCMEALDIVNTRELKSHEGLEDIYISTFYNRFIREQIREFKFHNKAYLYKPFGRIMAESLLKLGLAPDIDLIIPVPIHRSRENTRGYNQSELLARELGQRLGIDYDFKSIKKLANTKPQSSLGPGERRENLRGSFQLVREDLVFNKKILIVDDVFTTGSTLRELAGVINQVENKGVVGLALTSSSL